MLSFAEQLIVNKQVQAALDLNSYIKVMGKSVSLLAVREKIQKEYPQIRFSNQTSAYEKHFKNLTLYVNSQFKHGSTGAQDAIKYYFKTEKIEFKKRWFGSKYIVSNKQETHSFNNFNEMAEFVLQAYIEKYGFV